MNRIVKVLFRIVLIESLIISVLFVNYIDATTMPGFVWLKNSCVQSGMCPHP
ncbi:MAG: hypothetical protein WA063_00545 [Minisyncoccia bacterium]